MIHLQYKIFNFQYFSFVYMQNKQNFSIYKIFTVWISKKSNSKNNIIQI